VAGSYPSSDLLSGNLYSLNGDSVTIKVSDAGIVVNDAEVVTSDITANNGVIHVIDKVLLPPVDDVTEEPADVEATPTNEASDEAILPESQGENAGTAEAGLAESTESSLEIPAEDTIADVTVDTTISSASLESSDSYINSGSSASAAYSGYVMASIAALYFVSF
jgi:hypothetical protein